MMSTFLDFRKIWREIWCSEMRGRLREVFLKIIYQGQGGMFRSLGWESRVRAKKYVKFWDFGQKSKVCVNKYNLADFGACVGTLWRAPQLAPDIYFVEWVEAVIVCFRWSLRASMSSEIDMSATSWSFFSRMYLYLSYILKS